VTGHVIGQDLLRHAAERPECALHPLEPAGLALVPERAHVHAARVAERSDEQVSPDHLPADHHPLLAEVDLHLLAGRRLKPDRRASAASSRRSGATARSTVRRLTAIPCSASNSCRTHTENGMLRLLHDLGVSWQKARPIHPRPTARPRSASKKFPALIAEIARDHPEAARLEVWSLDEARGGQTGRVCRRWFERGMRPRDVRDLRHQAVYLFGAVCPERDTGVALVLPAVSAAAMQAMLDELG
jgi:hypothetical protein